MRTPTEERFVSSAVIAAFTRFSAVTDLRTDEDHVASRAAFGPTEEEARANAAIQAMRWGTVDFLGSQEAVDRWLEQVEALSHDVRDGQPEHVAVLRQALADNGCRLTEPRLTR